MKRFRETVMSEIAPEDKNVLWLDISDSKEPVLKYYSVEEWIALAGGGSGPTPTTLRNTYYYGALDNRATLQSIDITELSDSNRTAVTGYFNKVYYYIALTSDQSIVNVITSNQENIKSQFNYVGTFIANGVQYKLYEFFLDTLIPLDVTATISITGNTR